MYYFGKDYILMSKFVLIDGHSILNRAFYGVPIFTNSEGLHTNAVFGFLNIFDKKFLKIKGRNTFLIAIFNQGEVTFATAQFNPLKAP